MTDLIGLLSASGGKYHNPNPHYLKKIIKIVLMTFTALLTLHILLMIKIQNKISALKISCLLLNTYKHLYNKIQQKISFWYTQHYIIETSHVFQ